MYFILNEYTITINKTNDHIYLKVIDDILLTFEKYITQKDLLCYNNLTTFYLYMIKCLKHNKCKIELNKKSLMINFCIENISLKFKMRLIMLNEKEEYIIRNKVLDKEFNRIQGSTDMITIYNKFTYDDIVLYLKKNK